MTGPQEQFAELTRRTQENFKHMWEQWSQRSNELLKGVGRSRPASTAAANPEDVLDAVFDFAENLIAQQRVFAKQMLRVAAQGQQALDAASTAAATSTPNVSSSSDAGGSATPPTAAPGGGQGR